MYETLYPSPVRPALATSNGSWVPRTPGSHYRFSQQGHQLCRVVRDPDAEQVEALSRGEAEFALVLEEPLIVLCSRFGSSLPWSGGAFHWHRVPRHERLWPMPVASLDDGVAMDVSLVDAEGGCVLASRVVRLSPAFARVLHEALLEQARFPFDPSDERRALDGLLRRCPGVGALVANATVRDTAA